METKVANLQNNRKRKYRHCLRAVAKVTKRNIENIREHRKTTTKMFWAYDKVSKT